MKSNLDAAVTIGHYGTHLWDLTLLDLASNAYLIVGLHCRILSIRTDMLLSQCFTDIIFHKLDFLLLHTVRKDDVLLALYPIISSNEMASI